jgi:hypothetical protein
LIQLRSICCVFVNLCTFQKRHQQLHLR